MNILFDHSNPFLLAHGGLQIQIEQTRTALLKAGARVEYLEWWNPDQPTDLIHFFGRPHPSYIQQARQKGIRVVFSELLTGTGSRSVPALFAQALLIRGFRHLLPGNFAARMAWESYALADAVIALTEWEKTLMVNLFSAPRETLHVVQNGVEPEFLEPPVSVPQREPHLICTATITERKRVVELAHSALVAGVPVRFFGKPYSTGDGYFRLFQELVARSAGLLQFGGAVPDRAQLAHEYRSAAGFVLLSTMETQSLSALEAAACGCPLLLADLPWARSTFGTHASYAPLATPAKTAPVLRRFFDSLPDAVPPPPVMSWEVVARELLEVYSGVLKGRSRTGSRSVSHRP